jgi:hypothetical protein
MTRGELLHALQAHDVRLRVDGERLTYDAPAGVMTAELLALLRQQKHALLALLPQGSLPASRTMSDAALTAVHAVPAPLGTVGRHGQPCPQCGEPWQWPTHPTGWGCAAWVVRGQKTAPRWGKE